MTNVTNSRTLRTADLGEVLDLMVEVEGLGFEEEDALQLAGYALTGTNPSSTLMQILRKGRCTTAMILPAYRLLRDAGCFL